MRLFKCAVCAQLLYFENTRCEKCGHVVGYEPGQNRLLALEPIAERWRSAATPAVSYRFCVNAGHGVCNWLIEADAPDQYCRACRHNGVIPDLSQPANASNWRKIEAAKHRLFYTLLKLRLPLATRPGNPNGLLFNFLADPPHPDGPRVMTGHDSGVITLAVSEADDAERERRRSSMREPYRTLLGHFRHESGHYFWDRLVRDRHGEAAFGEVFGDETADYSQALEVYYAQGAPDDWQTNFVSAYATSHPWEDFAETFAHYLHILDTMEMARAFNLQVAPRLDETGELEAAVDFDPYEVEDFAVLVDNWLPIAFAMNSINRCMGQPDLYPFVLSPAVIGKLAFVHRLVRSPVIAPPPGTVAPEAQGRAPESGFSSTKGC